MSVVLTILGLGLLIIVHEGGHYFVAKWCGMRVEKFSLGFGPAILKWKRKGTQFQLAPIPLGGFVHITGMNPHEEYDEKDPAVYPNRPTIFRFLTIFAGPFTNILFSVFIIFGVIVAAGVGGPAGKNVVDEVSPGQPAEGELEPGDVITAVDGQPVLFTQSSFRDRVQQAAGRPVVVTVQRSNWFSDDEEKNLTITPHQDKNGSWFIGVKLRPERYERQPVSFGRAVSLSLQYPIVKSKEILAGLWGVVRGEVPLDPQSVLGIGKIMSKEFQNSFVNGLELMAMLNVYLGLFNLLPFPALDGGRLVFLSYELATRRRPNPKVEAAVHMTGFVVLFVIMILVFFKDIRNMFS
jgi:regulator of sigma E protease